LWTKKPSVPCTGTFAGRFSTDAITFDLGTTPEGWRAAAIAICVPVAQQYARQYRVSLREELRRLVIHGALHLLGHEDHTTAEKRRMRYQENKILRQLKQSFH
jgi:rRNA maturation RNase YbeY